MFPCSFFHHHIKSLPGYKNKNSYILHKGISFCTGRKASFTVEAAVLFPLTAGFLVSILFLFQILQVQICIENALFYAGKKTALESCLINSESALTLSAKANFLYALEICDISDENIIGGFLGVSLLTSEISNEEITLRASYYMKLPVHFFGKKYIPVTHENVFRKWNGENIGAGELEISSYVYVTPSGNAYHKTSECRSLDLSVKQVSIKKIEALRGEDGQKYYACSLCGEKKGGNTVYCTKYGYLYHWDINCSAIKRTILKVPITEIGKKTPCKYCY